MLPLLLLLLAPAVAAKAYYALDSAYPTGLTGLNISEVTAVAVVNTSAGALELHVAQRGLGSPPFLVLDTAAGSLLRSYGKFGVTLVSPHGLASTLGVGEPGPSSLWVTDIANGTVLQLDPATGRVLTLLGSKGVGLEPLQFSAPADLALDAAGALYIGDGDGGAANRVLKVAAPTVPSPAPAYALGHCASPATNTSSGCFSNPHSLAYSSALGHLWVADRGHNRLQAFSAATGRFLGQWTAEEGCFGVPGAQPWSVRVDSSRGVLLVADGGPAGNPAGGEQGAVYVLAINSGPGWSKASIGACAGALLQTLSVPQQATAKPHELAVDEGSGDVYLANVGVPPSVVRWKRL